VGCCRDLRSEYVLGNLLEQPADAIWNGERMVELRRALVAKRPEDISICKACDVPWHGSYSGRTPLEKVRNFFFAGSWGRYGEPRSTWSPHGLDGPRHWPHISERIPGAHADEVLPIRQEVGQLVGEPPSVEIAPALVQFVISRVGPLDVGND